MDDKSNIFSRFLGELKRRKTDRVIVFYAATAFIILQLTDILTPALSFPGWTTTFVIILLAIGFPVAAILSWVFDLTPEGIEKTKPYHEKKKHWKHGKIRTWKSTTFISIVIIIALIVFNIFNGNLGASDIKNLDKSIAVLPFSNLSNDENLTIKPEDIAMLINSTLSNISSFIVLPNIFTLKYKDSERMNYSKIGKELNVALIIDGQVHKIADSIIVSVQLIIAANKHVLWGNNYSLDAKMPTMWKIQRDLPIQIAAKLETELSPMQKEMINKSITKASKALVKYLEAKGISDMAQLYFFRGYEKFEDLQDTANFKKAIKLFDEAIESDPKFAYAYAQRAITRSRAYSMGDNDPINIDKCREDIDKALNLEPNSKVALIAEGFYYYYCKRDYQKALEYFKITTDQDPQDWQSLFFMSLVYRRIGQWDAAKEVLAKVLKFRPENPLILTNIGMSFDYLRDYNRALRFHSKAIKYSPDWPAGYDNKIETLLLKNGNTKAARTILRKAIRKTGASFIEIKIKLDLYDGKLTEALQKIEQSNTADFDNQGEMDLLYAQIHSYLRNAEIAQKHYYFALDFFKQKLIDDPNGALIYSKIGITYAGLKETDKAETAGVKGVELASDSLYRYERVENLAQIYTMLGKYDEGLKQIELLLKHPSWFSIKYLQLDPLWKPYLDRPEYQELLVKYSKI
jgi:tetratricopeptide (TPR) repeat protein